MTNKKRLTVICPVFNESETIPLFFQRFNVVAEKISKTYDVNLLFLNNNSSDKTYEVIYGLMQSYKYIYMITLSSNVGYQKSLDCGIRNAKGDLICFIDVDCEDPPEMILDFVGYYERGYDLIYGIRVDRNENYAIKKLRNFFYYSLKKVADDNIILFMAEFCLMTSEVRDAIISHNSSFPFIRSYISRVGYNKIGIEYKRDKRIAGATHYNILGMIIFAVAGILSSSTLPLRLPIYIFPLWILVSSCLGVLYINSTNVWYLFYSISFTLIYFSFSIAFIALYVGRAYKNILNYPNYFIDHKNSFFQ